MKGEPIIVGQLLQKAKDSALLAVEFYNKPAISFKSHGFIVMMCIAWTSLFNAYFFKKKIKPFYKKSGKGKKSRYDIISEKLPNGKIVKDYKWWDLNQCIKEYFKDNDNPVRKNLEFFTGIRNLIIHRNLPELDPNLFGECQANILNFNQFLIEHFGEKQRIDYMLSYSLQMFNQPKNFTDTTKQELKKKNAVEIVNFIKEFRSSLSFDIFSSPEYAFKAVLIQVKNHESKDTLALRFINEKDLTDEQQEHLNNMGIVLIKEKEIIKDDIPSNFSLTYNELWKQIKNEIPHIKQHQFNIIKILLRWRYKDSLAYERIHNPKSKKTLSTWYYDPKIVDKFKKLCPPITSSNEPIVKQIEALVDKILAAKKQNLQADTSEWEKEIDKLVYRLYDLTEEEVKIIEERK